MPKTSLAAVAALAVLSIGLTGCITLGFGSESAKKACLTTFDGKNGDDIVKGCDRYIASDRGVPSDVAAALTARGKVYMSKGEYDRAIQDFDRAIQLKSDDATPFNARGAAYYMQRQLDKAMQDFNQAVALDGSLAEAYSNRGAVFMELHQERRAIEDFDKAITLNPKLVHAHLSRCVANMALNQLKRALTDCNEAVNLAPELWAAQHNRGLVQLKLGESKDAVSSFDAALALRKSPDSLFARGIAKRKSGDAPGGNSDLSEAKGADKDVAERFARFGLGKW